MDNIKIKISTLVDGEPWLFFGDGEKSQSGDVTVLKAEEDICGEKVLHRIEIFKNKIKIIRLAENATMLEFYKDKKGDISIKTDMGSFSGKTITKSYAVKETKTANYISISYNTDFDSPTASVKKIQISYWDI